MSNAQVSPLSYVLYSIAQLTTQINQLLLQSDVWSDILTSSTGEIMVNFLVCLTNMQLYYVERTAEELYLLTAQKDSSINNIVALLNYTPPRNISATGSVVITNSVVDSNNIYFPAQTPVLTPSGYYYNVTQSSVLLGGQSTVTIPVVEGQWFNNTYSSNGLPNQTYTINNTSVENSNYAVVVNGVTWTSITTWINTTTTSQVYKVLSNFNGTLTIQFGNGVFGAIPTSGQAIIISYLQSSGANGNLFNTNVPMSFPNPIYDSTTTAITTLSATNPSPIIGGSNAQTAAETAYLAPQVFQTGQRAVTPADFEAILDNYPGVATSNVWGEKDIGAPNYSLMNKVFISTVLQNWQIPSSSFNLTVGNFLYNQSSLCVLYSFVTPQIIQVMPYVSLYVYQGYSLSAVQAAVSNVFQEQFLLGSTSVLGESIRYADVFAAMSAVPGLHYSYLTLAVYQPLALGFYSNFVWGAVAPLLNITPGTVQLHSNSGVLLAVDNGAGGWTSVKSGYTFSGSINYNTTGAIKVGISPAQSSIPYITYQQAQNGDLVVGRNQILQYYNLVTNTLVYG